MSRSAEVRADQLVNEHFSEQFGERTRFFFEGTELEFRDAKRHARRLAGLAIVNETWQAGPSPCWTPTLTYRGFRFLIGVNHHAAVALYFVDDPECPSDVLLAVLNHFNQVSRFSFTDARGLTIQTSLPLPFWILLAIAAPGLLIATLLALLELF